MCRPELSSKWEGDYRSLRESQFVLPQSVQEHLSWTLDDNEGNNDWFADGKVIDFFRGNLGHVRQLYFSGGEPLLSSSHRELVNLCIESGYAKNIELIYDTNGLGISEEWLKIWSQFGGIDIHISIDGLGEKYEYIRFPGKFVEFEKAARALAEWEFSGKKVRILVTLQALNILDQAEILDWYWTLFGRESQIRHSIVFGQVRWPECLSPRILPLEGRRRAFQKAEDYAHKLLASGVPKSELFPLGDLGRRMEFCFEDTQGGNKRVEDFLVYLGQLDQVRGTCWQKTFPELAGLIEEVGRG